MGAIGTDDLSVGGSIGLFLGHFCIGILDSIGTLGAASCASAISIMPPARWQFDRWRQSAERNERLHGGRGGTIGCAKDPPIGWPTSDPRCRDPKEFAAMVTSSVGGCSGAMSGGESKKIPSSGCRTIYVFLQIVTGYLSPVYFLQNLPPVRDTVLGRGDGAPSIAKMVLDRSYKFFPPVREHGARPTVRSRPREPQKTAPRPPV